MKKTALLSCCLMYLAFGIAKNVTKDKSIFLEKTFLENVIDQPILFLFLKITEQENALPTIELERVLRKKGKVKGDFSKKTTLLQAQNLVVSFYDEAGELLKKTQIENPLAEKIEGLNHDNEYEWTTIERSSNSFMVRTQDAENLFLVKIEKIQSDGSLVLLTRINLKNN